MLEQWKIRWDGRIAAVLLGRGGVAAVREGAEELGSYDAISSFPFSLECYKLFVYR